MITATRARDERRGQAGCSIFSFFYTGRAERGKLRNSARVSPNGTHFFAQKWRKETASAAFVARDHTTMHIHTYASILDTTREINNGLVCGWLCRRRCLESRRAADRTFSLEKIVAGGPRWFMRTTNCCTTRHKRMCARALPMESRRLRSERLYRGASCGQPAVSTE